jgi:hypothetical protein
MACDGSRRGNLFRIETGPTRIIICDQKQATATDTAGALCRAQCLPPQHREAVSARGSQRAFITLGACDPSMQTRPLWPGTPRGPAAADSVEVSPRSCLKDHLPACARMVG